MIDFNEFRLQRLERGVRADADDAYLEPDDAFGYDSSDAHLLLEFDPNVEEHARIPLVLAATPRAEPTIFLADEGVAQETTTVEAASAASSGGALVVRDPTIGTPTGVNTEYMQMILARSSSRELRDEVSNPDDPEIQAAAIAFAALDHDANGMLCFDEFEQLVVGTSMASSAIDKSVSRERMKGMWVKADINRDERVDFNEFVIMRRRAMQRATREAQKAERHGAHSHHGSRRSHGARSSSTRSDDGEPVPETGVWVEVLREEQRKGEARYAAAVKEHEKMVQKRFSMSDALADLTEDELLLLEAEVLTEFPTQLSAHAIEACLTSLGMRVGKMFDKDAIERFIATLLLASGEQKVAPAALMAALKAERTAE